MVKKAFLRTAEAVIAIVITFTLLTVMLRQETVTETRRPPENILYLLKEDPDFRTCVEIRNTACINQSINSQMPDNYDFTFNISEDPNAAVSAGLPSKRIFADAVLLTGNTTNSTTRIVRLFYWTR